MIYFYQNLPQYIDPIAFSIGSFAVRWYAISYIIGFTVAYGLLRLRISRGEFPEAMSDQSLIIKNSKLDIRNTAFDLLLVAFFSALIGGRLGYILLYGGGYFLSNPLAIISPYDRNGDLVGLYGMSYYGAILGVTLGSCLFLKIKKQDFLSWADFIVPAASLGYFFGRIGNFLNGELYGRITDFSLGVYFSVDLNHLRHPSQLYEALLEGLLLFVILWKLRNKKMKKGTLFAIYLIGYGALRLFSEQFREPDSQIGFLWKHFTLGQILSSALVFVGLVLLLNFQKKKNSATIKTAKD